MAHDHDDDPALAEALARRDESRAQILRSKAQSNPAYAQLADKAAVEAKGSATSADNTGEVEKDLSGTAPALSDSAGNFAANPEVAATGGIGIEASNTDVSTGKPAQTPEQAAVAVAPGARKIVGDHVVGDAGSGDPDVRAAVAIPDGWRDLSWQERRSIASKVSDAPISNGEEANTAIDAELKRRAK